ncbi:MAG TPA: hypothetical protein VFL07_08080 [Rudaea sp.]|nr:hypothetical protein [Rudaea sp.]HSC11208.1 hypothetical protein [Rhodanobacteraceae bacterium]
MSTSILCSGSGPIYLIGSIDHLHEFCATGAGVASPAEHGVSQAKQAAGFFGLHPSGKQPEIAAAFSAASDIRIFVFRDRGL